MHFPALHWPDGLDEQRFLDAYWQRQPLLIRQAFRHFQSPVTPDDLAGMSLEDDTTPRLILGDGQGRYTLEHGPFDEQRFAELDGNDWSLLVTDVEKHFPELAGYLGAFDFLPDWRIDDLMISYAPDGGSVGAHVDEYDVFLLQASGVRRWQIDTRRSADLTARDDCSMKILAHFDPDQTYELAPGDLLYLPPRVPHHGVAVGDDCTTWSIGLRAPAAVEMLTSFAEALDGQAITALTQGPDDRYRDPPLNADAHRGELGVDALAALQALWHRTVARIDADFASVAGTLLTRRHPHAPVWQPVQGSTGSHIGDDSVALRYFQVNPFSRLLFVADTDASPEQSGERPTDDNAEQVRLFADGIGYRCSRTLAEALCQRSEAVVSVAVDSLSADDHAVLQTLCGEDVLQVSTPPGE